MLRLFRLLCILLAVSLFTLTAAAQRSNPPIQPDPNLTPGDVLDVTPRDICVVGYTAKVRNVPENVKKKVYALYGIRSHRPGEYEVDHLISLELGGSNAIGNLWPQSYVTTPLNARVKDVLENKLHRLVCSGQLDLRTAQREIATDWIGAYQRYVLGQSQGPLASNPPRASGRSATRTATAAPPRQPAPRQPTYSDANDSYAYGRNPRKPNGGISNNPPPYSRNSRTQTSRRSAQDDPYSADRNDAPPSRVYRTNTSARRKQSKRCKLLNLWCGFGLLR